MTLDEAIIHAEEVAGFLDRECMRDTSLFKGYKMKCAEEHRQLADWLKAYKQILESGDCNECAKSGYCDCEPQWGEMVRYNCPFYAKEGEK